MAEPDAAERLSPRGDRATRLTRIIGNITGWLGSFPAILISVGLVIAWAIGGLFVSGHFDNPLYQLLINTGTTIVTFLMVFIIQNTQNREGRAVQAKLDAHTAALAAIARRLDVEAAEALPPVVRLVGLEDAPEDDIKQEQHEVRQAARRVAHGAPSPQDR